MYNLLAPWPPQANGIADYALEIARHSDHPVNIVTRALHPKYCGEHVGVTSDTYALRNGTLGRHPSVYHFGNNPDHVFLIPLFLRYPGVAVIHDVSLHYLVECANATLPGFFISQLAAESPRLAEVLRSLWRISGMKRPLDFQEFKLLNWLREASSIVVHSQFAARAVAPHLPGKTIHVVPHFAYRPPSVATGAARQREAARSALGIGEDEVLMSTVGFVTRNKQYDAVMRAINQLPDNLRRRLVFLIAGEIRPHEYDLEQQVQTLGCANSVRITGFLTETELQNVLHASDLVISLRYPTFGESSGSVARALGLGCAVVVTDGGSYAEIPDEVCIKIPAKADPSRELAELIRAVAFDKTALASVRSAALHYAASSLEPKRIARRYSEIAHA